MRLSIGDLGRRTGATVQTIRYYEKLGLMPPPFRTQATQRVYDETDIQRMTLSAMDVLWHFRFRIWQN